AQVGGLTVQKRISLRDASVIVEYRLVASASGTFETTLDFAMPCCDGFAGRYIHDGSILGGFGEGITIRDTDSLALDDRYMNGSVVIGASRDVVMTCRPYHTVSQSEDGLEKV